ncbi:MAG: S-adenosylmethionine decarboxylase [bacterium]|nr:S-adenosylmethionine decarboxylase [bacterium]
MQGHFGEHLLIDGYDADSKALFNEDLVHTCLTELCDLLGVLQLGEPLVMSIPDGTLKVPGGVTGIIVLAESHISIHTFPLRHFFSADIYSCKHDMDQIAVAVYLKKKFKCKDVDTKFILRGIRYPDHDLP